VSRVFSAALLLLHKHTSDAEWMSIALWAGIVVLAAVGAAGLLIAVRYLARKSAERTEPCPQCQRFYNPAREPKCPFCGRPSWPGTDADRPIS
jgi:hypothetical protein